MNKIFIIIPSKTRNDQNVFLSKALQSVYTQTILNNSFEIKIIVVCDKGKKFDDGFFNSKKIILLENTGNSQASALNTGIDKIKNEKAYVTFLEDDDYWLDIFLEKAIKFIKDFDFISSTQIEVNDKKDILGIFDFPTPSGWFMKIDTLQKVGKFNESFKWHLDNEWLGRLNQLKLKRCHLVESTVSLINLDTRPLLKAISLNSVLEKHDSPFPLVFRLRHSMAGMNLIRNNISFKEISDNERKSLAERFGGFEFTI